MNVLFQFVLPPLLGALAGWAAAYFQWDVEKRRARLARRAALVDTWRRELLEDWPQTDIQVVPRGGLSVTHKPAYASLRPHLSAKCRTDLEGAPPKPGKLRADTTIHVGRDSLRKDLVEEIGRIEKAWKLV